MQLLAVQIEIVVGAWLILGRLPVSAWLSALLLLVTLATVSATSAIRGQNDCGCFGAVKVHPGITTAINLVAVTLLVVFRPRVKWSETRGSVFVSLGLAVVALGLVFVATGPLGDRLLARWNGRTLTLQSSVIDAGEEPSGKVKRLAVVVTNKSDHDIRLIGGSVSCSCTTTVNLPITIPAESEVEVELELKFRGTPGQFDHNFELLTDDKTQPKLRGVIIGRVADAPVTEPRLRVVPGAVFAPNGATSDLGDTNEPCARTALEDARCRRCRCTAVHRFRCEPGEGRPVGRYGSLAVVRTVDADQ